MLLELRVEDLGIIAGVTLVLEPGMTALTGETGAGKTLVVEALELLVGGRADPALVRPGAAEALVEGRFEVVSNAGGGELVEAVLARAVPAGGRSRAWVNGRMAPVSSLAEIGEDLVELHGQHAHQPLLSAAGQRAALDAFCGVDDGPRNAARAALHQTTKALATLGGDARERSRQADLLRYQIDELSRAALADPLEDDHLALEEDRLAEATSHREAAQAVLVALTGWHEEGGASEALGTALAALAGHSPLAALGERLRGVQAELEDLAGETRRLVDSLEDDPERLAQVRARRQLLRDLERKYGDSLAEVMAFAEGARRSLAELESHEVRVAELEAELACRQAELGAVEATIGAARRAAAPEFARAVEVHLRTLAMAAARFGVEVGGGAGDEVSFVLCANQGEPVLPLTKVASGGELARTMLAVRLVLGGWDQDSGAPRPTLVFDEVDAGVGGEAALAVGRALAALGGTHQVLVVTHLAQVAAYADHQVKVEKLVRDGRTVAELSVLDDEGRVVELSRMLSGQPDSATAWEHAAELLSLAARERPELGRRPQRELPEVGRRREGPLDFGRPERK
jgi:DNA repair protein RecN (Recombination protein N)